MVAEDGLFSIPLVGGLRRGVVLEGAQRDQVPVEGEGGAVPGEAVHPVSQQRHLEDLLGIWIGRGRIGTGLLLGKERVVVERRRTAAGPVEIDPTITGKVRVQGNAQQPALGSRVHRQVQHSALNGSVHHPLHAAGPLLQHQKVIGTEKGDARGRGQAAHHGLHGQVGLECGWSRRLLLLAGTGGGEEENGQRGEQRTGCDQSASAPGLEAAAPACWGGSSGSH